MTDKTEIESYKNCFGLTNKQEAFAQAVITEKTLSDAYRKAYDCTEMSDAVVNKEASILNSARKITVRVNELRDRVQKAADVTLERVMREQARIAFADPLDFYNDDGTPKKLSDVSPDARAAIASLEIDDRSDGDDIYTVRKLKLNSKSQAQDSIIRMLGGYEKDNFQKADIYIDIPSDGNTGWLDEPESTKD